MADGYGHTHANAYTNADNHLDPIAHTHAHAGAADEYSNVDTITIGNPHAGAVDQHANANLIVDAYFYADARTDSYLHTIANVQPASYGDPSDQETTLADGHHAGHRATHDYAQSRTDWHAILHGDQHAKAVSDFDSTANGDSQPDQDADAVTQPDDDG